MCEQPGIAERMAEIQAERVAAIACCVCPPDGAGGEAHRPGCALEPRPAPPSQMQLTLEAMQRARVRLRQAGVPIREIGQSSNPTGASHDR